MKNDYLSKIESANKVRKSYLQKESQLSYIRLFVFIILSVSIFIFREDSVSLIIACSILLPLFTFCIVKHSQVKQKRIECENEIRVYENEINILDEKKNSYNNGNQFVDYEHPYTADLDVFGESSLFHYINRCSTPQGLSRLASWFSERSKTENILSRQESIKELAQKPQWIFKLLRSSLTFKPTDDSFKLNSWFEHKSYFSNPKQSLILHYLLPIVVGILIYLAYQNPNHIKVLLGVLVVNLLIFNSFRKKIRNLYQQTDQLLELLSTYTSILKCIENENFSSAYLHQLKKSIYHENKKPSQIVNQLSDIIFKLNYRNSMMGGFLNFTILWEMIYVAKLEVWKQNYQSSVLVWFESIGTFEALISLSLLEHNHNEWVYPTINDNLNVAGEDLGHPLIAESVRVLNPAQIDTQHNLHIITGSNMAGKSTYLRTLGINHVLALAGSVVCAKEFSIPNIPMFTYMRIRDSISDQTSTFYAEIKRLKRILDHLKSNETTLVLLDEILRGTNSRDKQEGSKAVIETLIGTKALTFIATHDLKLSELEQKYPQIKNYYFDIEVYNDDLSFDYKLKPGVCTTMNAALLLKKIGIHIKE